MATAQKAMGSMQRLKEDFATVRSVAGLFRLRAAGDAQRVAAVRKTSGAWKPLTWAELAGMGEDAAWGLIALGVKPGDKVSLVGSTRIEWTVADLGVAHAGGVSVPIYHSNTAEEIRYIVQNSGAMLVFAEDDKQLRKLREERARLPAVRHVVLLEGEATASGRCLSRSWWRAGRSTRRASRASCSSAWSSSAATSCRPSCTRAARQARRRA